MKKYLLFLLFFGSIFFLSAQSNEPFSRPRFGKAYFFEIGGNALGSFNLEGSFLLKENQFLSFRAGIGINKSDLSALNLYGTGSRTRTQSETYFPLTHHLTYNIGKKHCLELGLGGAWVSSSREHPYTISPIIGYRIHPDKSGKFLFRLFAQPPVGFLFPGISPNNIDDFGYTLIPAGVSFGATF